MMKPLYIITGDKFGKLTVKSVDGIKRNGRRAAICLCECGNVKIIVLNSLVLGVSKSCGCGRVEANIRRASHGMTRTTEYKIWKEMKSRCMNQNSTSYKYYGGRGITICRRWLGKNGFEKFFEDMGKRPSKRLTLDRKNGNGNYCPSNCRWATWKQQNEHERKNHVRKLIK